MTIYIKYFLSYLLLLSILAIEGCGTSPQADQVTDKPNIIIIYADDVGYGDISAYGSELIQTPHIDQLAEEGIKFTDAYATSAMCTPSRYSLLTGIYAFRLPGAGILSAEEPMLIESESVTLPGVLRKAGYRTSIVGKWHLGLGDRYGELDWNAEIKPGPLEVGFDESFLMPVTNDRVPTVYVSGHHVYGLNPDDDPILVRYPEEGHHEYQEEQFGKEGANPSTIYEPLVGNLPTGLSHPELLRYPADVQHSGTIVNGVSRIGHMAGGQSALWDDEEMAFEFTERSQRFIRENQKNPFFLFLSMHQNHVARQPHPQFLNTSGVGLRGDTVHELDWVVGQIVKTLDELNIREETLIIFTSDNGPVIYDGYEDGALEDHNGHDPNGVNIRGGKYIAYEGGTRMPTIAAWPNQIEAGQVSEAIISQVDFLATMASLAGADVPDNADLDSQDLSSALLGKSDKGRDNVIQQSSDGLAIRQGPWKYIEPGERSEWGYNRHNLGNTPLNIEPLTSQAYLFNLEEDSQETVNLAEKHPEIVREMDELLNQLREHPDN
ncbi:MAG: arylsulfatase [Balneolales bacterium]